MTNWVLGLPIALPFLTLFTLSFLLPCTLGAFYRYPYDPYYDYEFGYAKLPSSVRHITVAVPPPLNKPRNGKLYSRMDVPLPFYGFGRHALHWHPKSHRKGHKAEKWPGLGEKTLLKRQEVTEDSSSSTSPPQSPSPSPSSKTNKDELSITFLTPGKKAAEFKKKMDELKNYTADEKSQNYADEMEKFSAKPSLIRMGYKMLNWYKGYNESPAPFYSDPRTFNHPFGNKHKMLKIPPQAFATHYFQQDVPLITKSRYKKQKSWADSDNITPNELHEIEEEERREQSPKCTKGSSMLFCNEDALTEFMGALDRHVKKKPRSKNRDRGYGYGGGRSKYNNDDDDYIRYDPDPDYNDSRERYEQAKYGYIKGNSQFNYPSSDDFYNHEHDHHGSYDDNNDNNFRSNLDDYDVDIQRDSPVKILVVLTKKGFSGSGSSNSRSSTSSKSGLYPPKITYDTPTLIAGKHRESDNNPASWQDPTLFDSDRDSSEFNRGFPEFNNYNGPSSFDRPRKTSGRRDRGRNYDKLMDELMSAIEGRIQDMDPKYDRDTRHNPSEINENDYEPAPFWPVPRDFTSEERLKWARMKAAKAMNNGPDEGWFNRS